MSHNKLKNILIAYGYIRYRHVKLRHQSVTSTLSIVSAYFIFLLNPNEVNIFTAGEIKNNVITVKVEEFLNDLY
jgi:hypothetical protein